MRRVLFTLLLLAAAVAQAQVGLPNVRLPPLPPVQAPQIDRALGTAAGPTDARELQQVRRLRVRELIRRNPGTLEADPSGAAIVRAEIVALSPSASELAAAQAAGFVIARVHALDDLDLRVVVLRAPQGMTTARAFTQLRALAPAAGLDFNHVYTESGVLDTNAEPVAKSEPVTTTDPLRQASTVGTEPHAKLGLIDSGVDLAHPVFKGVPVHQYGCAVVPVPAAHGTAVASLMVGQSVDFHGAAPAAELYAADVYCGLPTGGSVDAVADAFAWLVGERVVVINASVVGPANAILEAVVRSVIAHGHIIVAAVGNDGPAAAPLYPASYSGVVGVTAVDAHRHALIEAARGPQVRFAAPGADMVAASSPRAFVLVRGTSFAAPLVAGLLAGKLRAPDHDAAARAVADLAARAIDLGAPGPDPVFGDGLVGGDLGPAPRLAGVRAR